LGSGARCGPGGPSAIVTRVTYVFGKILEVVAMLTLGAALVVYGFGENDMNAELVWLALGGLVFLAGYVLERRSARGR
jgi:ABC-type Na+ efflux pump permease subunit